MATREELLLMLLLYALMTIVVSTIFIQAAYGFNSTIKFWEPINVSNNASHSRYQDVLALKQHVYVAWMDGDEAGPAYDIYFKASHDFGKSFGSATKLSNGDGSNLPPKIAAFGSDVYVVWLHEGDGDLGAKFRASHDYGDNFDSRIDLGSDTWLARVDIAAYENNVYLVFEHPANPGTEMLFQASHDHGVSFGEPFIYQTGPCVGGEPHVAAWKNHVYVIGLDPARIIQICNLELAMTMELHFLNQSI